MGGFGRCFATLVFAQSMQPAGPALAHDAARPRATRRIIVAALGTTCVLYLLLGSLVSLFFRDATEKVATVNWLSYSGGLQVAPWWAHVVSRWVVVLPSITTTAAFFCRLEYEMNCAPEIFTSC